MNYIQKADPQPAGCVFCAKIHGDDAQEHILARGQFVYATLNRYPYNNGHLMIVPYKHVASQESLTIAELTEMMVFVNQGIAVLRAVYNPAAFNLGANIGAPAGAGIADHFHFHVVPRWAGDVNFMSTIAETRIIPDTLDNSYQKLRENWHLLLKDKNHDEQI